MTAEPLRDVPDAYRIRTKPVVFNLGPGDRHGNRSSALGSDSIWGDCRLRVGVSVDVEEEASLAFLLEELGGQVLGVGRRQALGDGIRKEVDLLETRTNGDRRDHVQAARPRGL